MPAGVTPAGIRSDLKMFLLTRAVGRPRIDYFFLRMFTVNIAKFWQRFRASKQRSSHARQNRLRLAIEVLEGRALPSVALPSPTVETGAALHLKPIDPAPAATHGVTFT